jgi:hypothetical protein
MKKWIFILLVINLPAFATTAVNSFEIRAANNELLVTTSDIVHAKILKSQGKLMLGLALSRDAADRFKVHTENHLGDELEVFVNGEESKGPIIKDVIQDGNLQIDAFGDGEVKNLVEYINHSKK